jgi:hypothetical protein
MVHYPLEPLTSAQQSARLSTMVVSSISSIASFSILLTLLVFPSLMKKKIYLQMVFLATMCDFIATAFVSIGFPTTAGICSAQASFTQFFLLASWAWTYFISQKLYCTLTYHGASPEDDLIPWYSLRVPAKGYSMSKMNAIIWTTDLFFFLLPFSTGTVYGRVDKQLGTDLCFFKQPTVEQKYYGRLWTIVCFYSPLLLLILGTSFHTVRLWRRFKYLRVTHNAAVSERKAHLTALKTARSSSNSNMSAQRSSGLTDTSENGRRIITRQDAQSGNQILDLVRTIIWYPICLIIAWTPNVLAYIFYFYLANTKYGNWYEYEAVNDLSDVLGTVTFSLGILYGVGAASIFFGIKSEARGMWSNQISNILTSAGCISRNANTSKSKAGKARKKSTDIPEPTRLFKEAYTGGRMSTLSFTSDQSLSSSLSDRNIEDGIRASDISSTLEEDESELEDLDIEAFPEYVYQDDDVYERASMTLNSSAIQRTNSNSDLSASSENFELPAFHGDAAGGDKAKTVLNVLHSED